ncbi:MAG: biotin transporter BioY [bacterium]
MKITTKDLSLMAILLAILIVCSKISFPIGLISVTLQTFAVAILSYILGVKRSLITISTYIIIGLIGIPVFSTGGGFSYILTPSFGFIIGFIPFSIILIKIKNFIISLSSLILLYLIGAVYMVLILTLYLGRDVTFIYVLEVAVIPFIIKDIISIILAKFIYTRIKDNQYIK